VVIAYFFSEKLFDAFVDYFKLIWWAILLGVFIGGVIDFLIPNSYISKYLSKHEKKTIFYSVIFGFLMSACSHGILAIAMELYKKGASISAVIAFLLASPWANLPIIILLFSFFGAKALLLVISAIVIAIITGLIYQVLEKKKIIEQSKHIVKIDKSFSIRADIKRRWRNYKSNYENNIKTLKGVFRGSWSLAKMVVWWILIGMILASFARAFVPHEFFVKYMGPTLLGLVVTLVIATIIEVCSEGSAPMAFELFKQTGAFGNSFAFLMVGVATDYTEIGLIWSNIGKKTALWLPVITVPQIIVLGYLFNTLL
ncbi:MAG: permease, partial [Flavobacteriales bacterium]|nr:permease [Flavobacteriales bacterium]